MARSIKAHPPGGQYPPEYMTYEEFLEWADEDTLAEWVDGVVVMTSPASTRHERITRFLVRVLSTFTEVHALGEVLQAPFQMKLGRSGREPDLLFVTNEHLDRLKKTYLDGPADLVVEVVSPESQERDRNDKFREYSAASIPEYWLIDPEREQAIFYQLDASGDYRAALLDDEGIYRSQIIPGFWLRVDWLKQDPLPDTTDVLLEIDGEAYARYFQERLRRSQTSSGEAGNGRTG